MESSALVIGVTGHRPDHLEDGPALRRVVRGVLTSIGCDTSAEVVSPLAEGADRIVTEEAADLGAQIGAVLPFPASRYVEDFADRASCGVFTEWLQQADEVDIISAQATDEDAYLAAGQRVVERATLMVAIWDGEPARGRGGTADIVAHARVHGVPVVWIGATAPHRVTVMRAGRSLPEVDQLLAVIPTA